MDYALFNYDIPYTNRSAYNKVRKATKRISLMVSWSCYLVPWALRDSLEEVMQEIKAATPGLRYNIVKFDNSEKGVLDKLAIQCFRQMISDWKDYLRKHIKALEADEAKALDKSMSAVSRCRRHLDQAKTLALTFMFSDDVTHAMAAFSEIIDEAVERINEKKAAK